MTVSLKISFGIKHRVCALPESASIENDSTFERNHFT